jgi:hypothetical protein
VVSTVSRERTDPIPSANLNCGIALPHGLQTDDIVTLCGMAWIQNNYTVDPPDNLEYYIGYIKCSTYSSVSANFPQTSVAFGNTGFDITDQYVCYTLQWYVTDNYDACDTFITVGHNVTGSSATDPDFEVKLTWTLSVKRSC